MSVRGAALAAVAVLLAGCGTTPGRPVAQNTATAPSQTASSASTSASVAPTPTGTPLGTAVMQVRGGDARATIRYRINGGAEQVEENVTLPWEKSYPVYPELQSEVSADSGSTELICAIIMDGKLLAFKTEPKPTCDFAYY